MAELSLEHNNHQFRWITVRQTYMLNKKTIWLFEIFICKFLNGKLKNRNLFCFVNFVKRNFPPDKRHPDIENTDHGPDMGFYRPLVNQSE